MMPDTPRFALYFPHWFLALIFAIVPAPWRRERAPTSQNSSLDLGLAFDSGTITYHLNGRIIRVFQQKANSNLAGVPLWIARCQGLGKQFFKGLVDEVRIYNRALSSEEMVARYKEDAVAFGRDAAVFETPHINIEILPEPGWIAVETDYGLMRPLPEDSSIEAQILDAQGSKTIAKKVEKIHPTRIVHNLILDAAALQPGDYLTRTAILAADGSPIGRPVEKPISWPGQAKEFKDIKILNNVVWEFLNLQPGGVEGEKTYA